MPCHGGDLIIVCRTFRRDDLARLIERQIDVGDLVIDRWDEINASYF
jgi:hypothetical protein